MCHEEGKKDKSVQPNYEKSVTYSPESTVVRKAQVCVRKAAYHSDPVLSVLSAEMHRNPSKDPEFEGNGGYLLKHLVSLM